jgi:FkbM family methyltransferase
MPDMRLRSLLDHFIRLVNARRFGVRFFRRATFQIPKLIRIGGKKVVLDFPEEIGTKNDFLVCFINDEYGLAKAGREVRTIVDIGSNAGFFSLAARSWFPDATIHAYEPNPRILRYLVGNTANVGIEVHPEAVGAIDGYVSIVDVGDSNLAKTLPKALGSTSIRQVALAKVIERLGGHIDLAKIDCEGAEWAMLADRSAWTRISKVRMEYHLIEGRTYADLGDALDLIGFEIELHLPSYGYGTIWARRVTDSS